MPILLKPQSLIALVAILLLLPCAYGDTLIFKNGDRLSGQIVRETADTITLSSNHLGELTISKDLLKLPQTPPVAEKKKKQPESDTLQKVEEDLADAENSFFWSQFFEHLIPEQWSGKLSFGLQLIESRTEQNRWQSKLNLQKKTPKQKVRFAARYDYATQKNRQGVRSKITDKMTSNINFEQTLSDSWFFQSTTDYQKNLITNLDHQARQSLGVGYKVINQKNFYLSFTPAVSAQYSESEDSEDSWQNLASLFNDFEYKINRSLKLKQEASININPENTEQYQTEFHFALISKITDWAEAEISYENSLRAFQTDRSPIKEEKIIFGLGFPF